MVEQAKMLNDLKLVLDITSRVDERVKMIAEGQSELTQRLNKFIDEHNSLAVRVKLIETFAGDKLITDVSEIRMGLDRIKSRTDLIESIGAAPMREKMDTLAKSFDDMRVRLEQMELSHNSVSEKFKHIGGLIVQGIWVIIVCYVLFRLGINSPPLP